MNDHWQLEAAVERAMQAEAQYKRTEAANRAHNRRMVWVAVGVALMIAAAIAGLVVLWPAL